MEVRKIITALFAAAVIAAMSVTAFAADEVIYENKNAKTGEAAVDLEGWGYELLSKAIFEADVKFGAENSGITLRSKDNAKGGTSIRAVNRDGVLTMAAYGGVEGNYIYYNAIDSEKTYHISLIGTYGVTNGMIDMTIDTLDENGNVEETKNAYLILMNEMYASSNVGPEHIRLEPNTEAENIKVTLLKPDSIGFSSVPLTITAGSETQLSAKFYRKGEELEYDAPIIYDIGYDTAGTGVSISEEGILKAEEQAPEQEFTVIAEGGDMIAEAKISLVSGDIFTVNAAMFNEDGTVLKAVNAVKNYFYAGNAVFLVTVYDENNILRGCFTKSVAQKAVPLRADTDIILDYTLPEDYDSAKWTTEINVWGGSDMSEVPVVTGKAALRSFFEENGGAVEWISEHRTVAGMLNGKTAALQIDNSDVYIDGIKYTLSAAPYIEDDLTYVNEEFTELMR